MKFLTARRGRNPRLCSALLQRLFAQSHAHLAKFGVETEAVPGFRAPKNNLKETLPRKTTSWYVANAFDEGFQLSIHHVSITVAAFEPDRAVFDKVIPFGKPTVDP
jgi:hypothetical protein